MERAFAESKTQMMLRLQEDFDAAEQAKQASPTSKKARRDSEDEMSRRILVNTFENDL
jgi:hypothetical protein